MRIQEQVILSALQKGACIKTFTGYQPGQRIQRTAESLTDMYWNHQVSDTRSF